MNAPDPLWLDPPADLTLPQDEVHIWRAALNLPAASIQRLYQTLSDDEKERAERFHFENDRRHFVAARGALRTILGRYLGVRPRQLHFGYSPYGKPYLLSGSGVMSLHFNVSHSRSLALYALAWNRKIGIDVEHIRSNVAYEQIAELVFSQQERVVLRGLAPPFQAQAFFNGWTRKEAYIKARGEGLSFPMDQFDVSLTPGEPAMLLNTCGDMVEPSRWLLQELVLGPDFAATLAVEAHELRLCCWQWPEEAM